MSVKIRINSKKFLGEGLLIGSRLNEEGEAQQPAANGQTATPANSQTATQTNGQTATPANGQTATPNAAPVNNTNVQNVNTQGQNQQGNIAQQLQQVWWQKPQSCEG